MRVVAKLAPGAVQYTVWCDDAGKVLDDGTLFHWPDGTFLLCCQERHLPWLLDAAQGFDVAVADVTTEIAALSLQGPCTASVLREMGCDVDTLKPYRMIETTFEDAKLAISRTGFTGDLGYELWIDPAHAVTLWDRLMTAGAPWGIRPVGTEALDLARFEAGFIVANIDFVPAEQALREDRVRSPFELGLDWLIDWDKGHFNGRRALLAERDGKTSDWQLVGLDIDSNVSAEGSLIYHRGRTEVGFVTSAAWSPVTKRSVALAQVRRGARQDDLRVEVYARRELQYARLMLQARVVDRPFYATPRRRATPPRAF